MTHEEFNAFCAALPATTHVVQWGGADVWKVGGKVFAIGGWSDDERLAVTFKVSDIAYEVLQDQPRLPPGPLFGVAGYEVDPKLRRARVG